MELETQLVGEEAGPAGGGGWSSPSAVEAAVFPAPWPTVVTVCAFFLQPLLAWVRV